MKDKTINDSAVNASSWFDERTGPEKARLDMWEKIGDRIYAGWRAGTDDKKRWLQVNLGRVPMKITRIATQGGRYYYYDYDDYKYKYKNCWVTYFSLHNPEDFHEQNNKVRT